VINKSAIYIKKNKNCKGADHMNKTDVVTQTSQKSGISADICEKVIKAFEEQSGDALIGKFRGVKNNRADMVAGIAEKTGLVLEDCEKVLTAFEEVAGKGLADKLKFFK